MWKEVFQAKGKQHQKEMWIYTKTWKATEIITMWVNIKDFLVWKLFERSFFKANIRTTYLGVCTTWTSKLDDKSTKAAHENRQVQLPPNSSGGCARPPSADCLRRYLCTINTHAGSDPPSGVCGRRGQTAGVGLCHFIPGTWSTCGFWYPWGSWSQSPRRND